MPIQRTSAAPAVVREAISNASQQTGASFEYLLNTAQRESSMRTNAKSSTSTAAGLFQFVESTWLKVVKDEGDRLGLSQQSKHIMRKSDGQYYVPNAQQRKQILALRHDAETAALVAGAYTENNARYVASRIGREPSEGELYLAHFLGPGNAARMIELVDQQPNSDASRFFPRAAKANKSIFYDGGQPRSLGDVYQTLMSSHVDEDSDGGLLQTRYGPLDFGAMGSLIADIEKTDRYSGKAQHGGSVGIWGDDAAGDPSAPSSSAHFIEASAKSDTDSAKLQTTASSDAPIEQHSYAAQQYRNAAQSTVGPQSEHSDWAQRAFGGS